MRLGLLSDLHCELAPPRQRSWINAYEPHRLGQRLERAAGIFDAEQPDIVLLLGDIAELADRAAFDFVFARLHELRSPLIAAVAGNHDGGADTKALEASVAAHGIRLLRGEAVGIRGASLVGLGIAPVASGGSAFSAEVPELTGQGAVTIVASHFPLCSYAAQLTVGALIEAPFDCAIVDVQGDGDVTVRRRTFTLGDAPRINPVFAPADERWRWSGDHWREVR